MEACSGCKIRPVRAKNQRYCKICHNEASKKYRAKIREIVIAYRATGNISRETTS